MNSNRRLSNPPGLLFLCVANSARSQMAEGLARARFGASVVVQSAGSAPRHVNPFAVRAMAELGVDLASHASKSVADIDPATVDLVVTLCAEEVCPTILSPARSLHWPFPDPDRRHEDLTDEVRLAHFRQVRDAISARLAELTVHLGLPAETRVSPRQDAPQCGSRLDFRPS
jgi:arsenate reductase